MPGEDPLLVESGEGRTLLWKGLSFYPSEKPLEYARRKARVFSPPPRSLVFVPSVGLGHGLSELLERLPEGCAVLCVEAFQEVMAAALSQGLPADPRLSIVRTAEPAGAAAALESMGIHRFRRVVELPLCAGYRLAPELYARCRLRLEEEIRRYWQNRLTLIALGSLQVSNVLLNLALLPGAHDLSALATTRPVVVAGAGPSLDECIPAMTRLRRGFVLAAVDTAFPCLAAHGIFPDIVVALEAQVANMQDFLPFRSARTLLACDLSSHPAVNRLFTDRLYYFSSRFAPLRLFDRLAEAHLLPAPFPALGSVGVAAVHAGLQIGRGDVFLTGLDLSFPGARTHAQGSPYHLAMLNGCSRLRPVGQDAFQ
ncbi:MAG: 6-hydroxymethylpterin diphosphokinase MptE-like protein, partial [Spirochaetia bacterium]